MKPQLTLLAFFLFFGSLTAQVKFKVKLLTDNQTYQVSLKPDANWSGALAATSAAGVRLRTPIGGAALTNITNQKGAWSLTTVNAPIEAPGYTYFLFDLDNPLSGAQITYTAGVEIPLFTFKNTGSCTGPIQLVDNATDPFNIDPNSMSLVGNNFIEISGAGSGVNAFTGNYGGYPADCKQNGNGCIEVYDVALVSPSACGVADGSITVSASNTFSFPMQYSINFGTPGVIWQSSPTFTNLAAGDTYYVAVRVQGGLCDDFLAGEFELQGPLAAIIQSVDLNNPSCGGNNG
ncbi:MAG: hypothetical protein IT258_13960, partial [Saprospiraceae bacterium]|nr:hypothetical protein [Saprospiraceae bacterium]